MATTKTPEVRFIPSSMSEMFLKRDWIEPSLQLGLDIFSSNLPLGAVGEADEVQSSFVLTKLGIKNIEEMKPYIEMVCLQELRRFRIIPPEA
jgi:hypothetical protein